MRKTDNWVIAHGGVLKWGASVYPKPGETIEHLLKRFNKKIQKLGVLRDYKEATVYSKESERRHRKRLKKKSSN